MFKCMEDDMGMHSVRLSLFLDTSHWERKGRTIVRNEVTVDTHHKPPNDAGM